MTVILQASYVQAESNKHHEESKSVIPTNFTEPLRETWWSDYMTKGWSSAEEPIISIIDRDAKGQGHNANAEEKMEQVPLGLEFSLSLLSFGHSSYLV